MKKIIATLLMSSICFSIFATTPPEDTNEAKEAFMADGKSLFEEVSGIKKKTDKFNLLLNMQGSGDLNFRSGDGLDNGVFKMRQLRIEAKGQLNSWLSYRWRHRLNRSNDGNGMIDNLPTSIDIAGIGLQLNDKFSLFLGKQCAAYGGIEFDVNPIVIYEYSDMIDNMSNFLTGVNLGYAVTPKQELNFQILNSRNNKSIYDFYHVDKEFSGYEDAKLPLVYSLNWNGNFKDIFKTRWSVSYMNQAKDNKLFYLALGNQLDLGKFSGFFDVMYSKEDLDRKNVMHAIMSHGQDNSNFNMGADYLSLVLKLEYHITPKWNLFTKGMYETASLPKQDPLIGGTTPEKGKYRTSLGYLAGVEYYPMADGNLHFFLTYVGRAYKYKDRAKELGLVNYNTDRLSVGFIYQLPMF